jgi:hypothetical protein
MDPCAILISAFWRCHLSHSAARQVVECREGQHRNREGQHRNREGQQKRVSPFSPFAHFALRILEPEPLESLFRPALSSLLFGPLLTMGG